MDLTGLFLIIAALLSSTVSGLVGMAGGIILLAAMTLVMPVAQVIPIHGMVQLTSNFSRSMFLISHVNWRIFRAFLCGVPIGGYGAFALLDRIDQPDWVLILIVVAIMYVVFKPKSLPEIRLNAFGFALLGAVAAFLGCLMGATGPLLAIFFVRDDLTKESIVATKAIVQSVVHLVKIPVFVSLVFPYDEFLFEIVFMSLSVVVGTRIGVFLLKKVSQERFMKFVKVVMFLIACRLVLKLSGLLG